MIKNYFIIAIRNFWRNKIYSLINISGLAASISAAIVIYLIVQFDFSFEKLWKDKDRIYRIVTEQSFAGGEVIKNSAVPMPLAEAARKDLTGIDNITHFFTEWEKEVKVPMPGSKSPAVFNQSNIIWADEYYFSVFEYDWIAGSAHMALKDPYQVVLTEDRASNYFGSMAYQDMIGRQIIYSDSINLTVSGIVKAPSEKTTDFRFKEFASLATMMKTGVGNPFGSNSWNAITSTSQVFVKLKTGAKPEQFNEQLAGLKAKYKPDFDEKYFLQPLNDIHFLSDYISFYGLRQAHKPTLYGLLTVAIFLLLLGCINFINLTTSRAIERAKEIGIRKALGSGKAQLIFQFLTETLLFTLFATALSIVLLPVLLKIFSDFIPPEINVDSANQLHVWIFLVLLVFLVTIFSGFYPALVLTRFRPATVLKNQLHTTTGQSGKAGFRKALIIAQFVVAQFLIIATIVVAKQISFSMNKDLGYKKDGIIYFPFGFSEKPGNRHFVLIEKIKAMPEIESVSIGSMPPAHETSAMGTLTVHNGKKELNLMTEMSHAGPDYYNVYNIKTVAGRLPVASDTLSEYVVNEAFTKYFEFERPEDAIGKVIDNNIPIVGVLKDFHTRSTYEPIKAIAYSNNTTRCYYIHIAFKSETGNQGSWKTGLQKIEKEFKKVYPEASGFGYNFFDETIAELYKKEQSTLRLLKWATGVCIFISCFGLLGLVISSTNARTKEIGIRKVMGASVTQIVSLLSKDLVSLVIIAFVIASPLAWLAMNKWLQDFAYRTNISWWVFAACGISMLLFALIVLSVRTVKAAVTNPVKSLRTE